MDFNMSDRQKDWLNRVQSFMHKHVRPAVPIYRQQDEAGERWKVIPILEDLKKKAKAEGLWNMFMPPSSHEDDEFHGAGLTNLEYALLAEEMEQVASYLLAPGYFQDQLHTSGADWVTEPLGSHPALAGLVIDRYRTAVKAS